MSETNPKVNDETRRRRILFRATHRGTYENDILIGRFVRARLAGFTTAELDALEAVMDLPDALLADWLTGREPIPEAHDGPMLRAIRGAAEAGEGPASMTATVYGAPEGYDALLLMRRRLEHKGPILHVTRDDSRMARLAEALAFFAPKVTVLRFPAWDCLPYDRVSPNPEIVSERIATLARLQTEPGQQHLVLTTVNAWSSACRPAARSRGVR